ncbi:MAG: ATP-binding cassette domain-containing protein [Verrucomicrobiales bacterium]|nr:ATP-binding cassette domain-containing protein [Verrucomicrobiales bacterium]MCP5556705.1 ATP-binding cassette domain-containing protein [Verrucomicrobiaceae bacterium]
MPAPSLISARDLRFDYGGESFALSVDAVEVSSGRSLGLLGPSGAGKTTLLRLLTGLLVPRAGKVWLGETEVSTLQAGMARRFRLEQVGLVFQDFALLDYLTAGENILLPGKFLSGAVASETEKRGRELAERMEIKELWNRPAVRLSQGERQRVAVARALVQRPKFVFADEPTASLDPRRRELVADVLFDYAKEAGAPLVFVTHDSALVERFDETLHVEALIR